MSHNPDQPLEADVKRADGTEIVRVLDSYRTEGEEGRRGGSNPRDLTWETNWNRYWGRYPTENKADWQSKHVMPEAPQFIDRWAAALREALDVGEDWFTVEDPAGKDSDLIPIITRCMKIILSRCAFTPDGHRVDFTSVFEDQMKLGALMALCASVTWRDSEDGGFVCIESTDAREVWYDAENRNLYRRRRYQLDKHELLAMVRGTPDLYDVMTVEQLTAGLDEDDQRRNKEVSTGSSQARGPATRTRVDIDEWLATVILPNGEVVSPAPALIVVANSRHLIRGPEENPYWHKRDWIVFTPMIGVPLSVYGRTYMEDWGSVADAFVDMTQMILDGVYTSTLKAFVARPNALNDPTQITEGVSPNGIFELSEDFPGTPEQFIKEIDLGTLPAEAIRAWEMLKNELREGAKLNEVALGQSAPFARTTAFEIQQTQQSGSAMVRSMARTIESRFLEPVLNMAWMTFLQHADFTKLAPLIGEENAMMLQTRREEFRDRPIQFRVRAISGLVDRQSKLRNLLQLLQVCAQNETLLQVLFQKIDPMTLIDQLFVMFGLDPADYKPSEKELALRRLTAAPVAPGMPGAQPQGAPGAPQ